MFYYLKGKVALKGENYIVLDNNGIGFKVYTSQSTLSEAAQNADITVYTYANIREDAFDIYGFLTNAELDFFQKLLSISGVGPRVALAILSTHSPSDMIAAVLANDAKTIARAPGVGSKLAQRIVLELKDKLKDAEIENAVVMQGTFNGNLPEAVSALIMLGYSDAEARRAIKVVGNGFSLEDTIKKALTLLAG